MAQMARGGLVDGVFEEVLHAHVDQTTTEFIIPLNITLPTGCYVVVALPLITAQDGIDEGTYIFKAGGFAVSHYDHRITPGTSAIFNKTGAPDYWGIGAAYVDSTTKEELKITCGGGQVSFAGNHDLYLFRVKGD